MPHASHVCDGLDCPRDAAQAQRVIDRLPRHPITPSVAERALTPEHSAARLGAADKLLTELRDADAVQRVAQERARRSRLAHWFGQREWLPLSEFGYVS